MASVQHRAKQAAWGTVELGSCFELQNGVNFSAEQKGAGLLMLDVLNVFSDDLYVRTDRLYRVDIKVAEDRLLRPGDVLFVRSSVKESGVGWPAIFKGHDEPVTNCGFLIRARQTSAKLEPRFLVHYLRQGHVRAQMISRAGKVAITNINQERLGSLNVPLPPLVEQRRIADVLDQAEALRAKRRAAFAKLDTLTQSIFLDLFGDPALNQKGWPEKSIAELCEVKGGKRLPKGEEYSPAPTEFRYIRVTDLKGGLVDQSALVYLKPEIQAKIARYIVNTGDVIISIAGSIGLIAAVPATLSGANLTENAAKLVPRVSDVYDADFLASLLQMPFAQHQIDSHIGQVTIGKLALFRIEKLRVPLPPLSLQREFNRRVAAIKNLKSSHRDSLSQMDTLFSVLQHRAFRGEL